MALSNQQSGTISLIGPAQKISYCINEAVTEKLKSVTTNKETALLLF
jgi:hypothetical protein